MTGEGAALPVATGLGLNQRDPQTQHLEVLRGAHWTLGPGWKEAWGLGSLGWGKGGGQEGEPEACREAGLRSGRDPIFRVGRL